MGEMSCGGLTRGDHKACEHDLGWQEKYPPCGIREEATGELSILLGSSSKTRDFLVDALEARWAALDAQEQAPTALGQSKRENGPESRGMRTQFLPWMVPCADHIGKPVQLLSSPPSHSKYHPIERCWGIGELPWKGTKLINVETRLEGERSMTWKGLHLVVARSRKVYQKGISLGKRAMRAVEKRLERHPELPTWDILIRPASAS
jgi:hypothetical protein